jgi:predicted ATPase
LKISRISIKNYRGIREANVTLTDGINTLVGKNNTGKSSFIDAILFASEVGPLAENQAHPDCAAVVSRGGIGSIGFRGRGDNPVAVEIEFSDAAEAGIGPNPDRPVQAGLLSKATFRIALSEERLSRELSVEVAESHVSFRYGGPNEGVSKQGSVEFDPRRLAEGLGKCFYLSAERRSEPTVAAIGGATLDPSGSNLLQVLNDLAAKRRSLLISIIDQIRGVVPEVEDLIAGLADQSNSVVGTVRESAFPEFEIQWSRLASGTRQVVLLATFALSAPAGSLLLIEEPELFLHTQSIWKLLTSIGLDATAHSKQIIISSHSPVVIELVGLRNCLLTVRRPGNQGTTIERLDEYAWLDNFLHKHGFMIHALLVPTPGLRVLPGLVLLVEGREDVIFWEEVLEREGLSHDAKILHLRNGGWTEALKAASLLKHLKKIGMAEVPQLVVIEEDGQLEEKKKHLEGMGLDEADYAILPQQVEAYFISAPVLAAALGVTLDDASLAIENTAGRPSKTTFYKIVESLTSRPNIDDSTRRRFAESLDPLPEDILTIVRRIANDIQK